MKANIYTQDGKKKGSTNLNKDIFEVKANAGLVHEALVRHLANKRQNIACVKTRGDVRGGGKKPWRQKGTGRARQGTIRAPHWKGGGAVFAPTGNENYSKQMPKKMRRKALFASLSSKAKDVLVLEEWKSEKPSTKAFASLIDALPIERNVLLVFAKKDINLEKSASNIQNVKTLMVNFLNVHDVLKYEKILFMKDALKKAEDLFLSKK